MIKTVIRCIDDTVMAFDEDGELMTEFVGNYLYLRRNILEEAPADTIFSYYYEYESALMYTPREAW